MREFIDIIVGKTNQTGWSFMRDLALSETAPPGAKAERFIKHAKKDFKKRYGKNWKKVLYATAWKNFSESAQARGRINEAALWGLWITTDGEMLPVSLFAHREVADSWLKKHNIDATDSVSYCIRQLGWIRVVTEGAALALQFQEGSLSRQAAREAEELIKDEHTQKTMILMSIMAADASDTHRVELGDFERKKALQIIRQNVRSRVAA